MKNKFLTFLMTFRGVIFIFLMIISNQSYSQNKPLFEQGKSLYKVEKYQEAITSWMKILDHEKHSSELYFNLGNAHYKLNNIGPSIYYFEKKREYKTDFKTWKFIFGVKKCKGYTPKSAKIW